jgi:hypothetical protein
MLVRDDRLGVERRRDRNRKALGQLHDLRFGSGGHDAAAGNDDRLLRSRQEVGRAVDVRALWLGTKGREVSEALLGDHVEIPLLVQHLPRVAPQLQVHRPGRAGRRDPEGLAQQVRQAVDGVDGEVGLGHRIPGHEVLRVLVGVAVPRLFALPAGDRNDGRGGHVGVAQPGRQVRRADVLAQRDPGLVRCARVSVGHIRRCLLAVRDHTLDAHLVGEGHGAAEHGGHVEEVGDVVGLQRFDEILVTGHSRHNASSWACANG